MAWRIDEQVVRGEIDNRARGRVTGRIWFVGKAGPVELDLAGNAWRDLAGRRLEFINPEPKAGDLKGLRARQTGVVGVCTASRKVKTPDVSVDEALRLHEQRKPFPWHWSNSLYLEWFSAGNGRVLIESAAYKLTVDPEAAWEMSANEEEAQRRATVEAMGGFFQQLGEAAVAERTAEAGFTDDISPDPIETAGDDELASDPIDGHDDEAAFAAEYRREHPLARQGFEAQLRFRQEAAERGWIPADATDEHPVVDLVLSTRDAARKLAGALNSTAWPPSPLLRDDAIERLRKARGHLAHALLAGAYCEKANLVEAAWLAGVQREVNALMHACDLLVGELRAMREDDED